MTRYEITVDGYTFDVKVLTDPQQGQVQVAVDGQVLTVDVRTVPEEGIAATSTSAVERVPTPQAIIVSMPGGGLLPKSVRAPLPGVVKSIAVSVGDQVAVGDKLLVIEAMKMDNVIRATREGIIGQIHVTQGQQVVHGEPMLEYRD